MKEPYIIIFDGVCIFCNGAVRFIFRRDPRKVFVFSPMQSRFSKSLIEKYKVKDVGYDTFLLIKNGKCYLRTEAALEIAKDLSGYWVLFNVLKVLPRSLRDFFYRLFARNRYAIFGRSQSCMVPTPALQRRFILDKEFTGDE